MANSGIPWIDSVFDWCVLLLSDVATVLDISYEEINVWLFVIIGPILVALSVVLNVVLLRRLRQTNNNNQQPTL